MAICAKQGLPLQGHEMAPAWLNAKRGALQ